MEETRGQKHRTDNQLLGKRNLVWKEERHREPDRFRSKASLLLASLSLPASTVSLNINQ